jgi:hypothetical protein
MKGVLDACDVGKKKGVTVIDFVGIGRGVA